MKTSTMLPALSLLSLLGVAALAGACSSKDAGDGDGDTGTGDGDGNTSPIFCTPINTCPPSVDGVDLMVPEVQFRRDIYEAHFRNSCGGGSGCHGGGSTAAAGLHFGKEDEPLDDGAISTLILQLTTSPSKMAPTEMNVVAGDWENSWLMSKLDGCQGEYGIECDSESEWQKFVFCGDACGDGMPASSGDDSNPNAYGTDPDMLLAVRRWIAQGAKDN